MSEPANSSKHFTKLIPKLVKNSPQLAKLYHIARVLEEELDLTDEFQALLGKESTPSPPQAVNTHYKHHGQHEDDRENEVKEMTSFTQFPRLLKKQFLLPDPVFDQRLMRRELLIQAPVLREPRYSWDEVFEDACQNSEQKRLKRQRTYLLMDTSASTAQHDRLELQKAIALLHLGSHHKGQGEIYFRTFQQRPGPLFISKTQTDWNHLVERHLLNLKPAGQTQLQKALLRAIEDIRHETQNDPWEILVITDGLCTIDPDLILDQAQGIRIHIVLVGEDKKMYSDLELRDMFKKENPFEYERIEKCHSHHERQALEDLLEKRFRIEKKKLPARLNREHFTRLKKLCEKSEGLWIECPDLNDHQLSQKDQQQSLEQQFRELCESLDDSELSAIDKENLLLQFMSLQTRLQDIQTQSVDESQQAPLDQLDQDLKDYLSTHHDLQDMILEQNLKLKWSNPGGLDSSEFGWAMLLKYLKKSIHDKLDKFLPQK